MKIRERYLLNGVVTDVRPFDRNFDIFCNKGLFTANFSDTKFSFISVPQVDLKVNFFVDELENGQKIVSDVREQIDEISCLFRHPPKSKNGKGGLAPFVFFPVFPKTKGLPEYVFCLTKDIINKNPGDGKLIRVACVQGKHLAPRVVQILSEGR